MGLPRQFKNKQSTSLTNYTESRNFEITHSKNEKDKIYRMVQNNIDNCIADIDKIKCLSLEILLTSPYGFFNRLQNIALDMTISIQDTLSRKYDSSLVNKVKEDPTQIEAKKEVYTYIYKEYLTFDSTTGERWSKFRKLSAVEKKIILAMIYNEICGLGPLEPLYNDHRVTEIICNGPFDIQVEIDGRLRRVPGCQFRDTQHIEDLINRLYRSVNKDFSRSNPYELARLHDKSRVFAVGTSIAPDGPNLNIRRHTDDWISPEQLINWGACSEELMEWLGNMINSGCSFVVNGGTGSGKTTMLAALTGFFPNDKRLVTIEKNIELKPAKGKLIAAAMECIPRKNTSSRSIEVTMRDLVICTTQMRPDVIICGEVVSDEAYDLVQAGNTGHQIASTIHSNNSQECIYRLMSLISQSNLIQGRQAYDLIASSVDFIITVSRFPQDGSRKLVEIAEVSTECVQGPNGPYLPVTPIWQFIPDVETTNTTDKVTGRWVKVNELSDKRRNNHHLDIVKHLNYDELQDLYKEANCNE